MLLGAVLGTSPEAQAETERGDGAVSHTTEAAGGTVFIHNGGYDGDVRVVSQNGGVLEDGRFEVDIPFTDLRSLVLDYLRQRMISGLESMNDDTLEQVLTSGTGVSW
jgi:hypothetical protein